MRLDVNTLQAMEQIPPEFGPVSYTHLDVYKRQEYSIVVGAGGNQANGGDTKAMGVTASGGKRGGPCLLYTSRCV